MSQSIQSTYSAANVARVSDATETLTHFLAKFANRQLWMRIIQSNCVGVVSLLSGVILIMAVDWTGWLPNSVRWFLTCVTYGIALIMAWRNGLSAVVSPPNSDQVAWAIEQAHPNFREGLVSAVELRSPEGSSRSGSLQFVQALEQKVAQELRGVDIDALLPWNDSIRKALIAVSMLAAILAACCIPGARMPERLARALLPFVDFERPSNVSIAVLKPTGNLLRVPSEQVVAFQVEIAGGTPKEAILEWYESNDLGNEATKSSESQRRLLPMQLESESPLRFALTAPIGNRKLQYRILAGDAITRWRTIEPVSRPKVLAFHSEVSLPEYAGESVTKRSQDQGNLQVLRGSHVRIALDVNQRLQEAKVVMEQLSNGKSQTFSLSPIPDVSSPPLVEGAAQRFVWEADIEESVRYQVRLVSEFEYQGQRLENTFSPTYKIDSVEDRPATLQWIASERTFWSEPPTANQTFIVAPDELVGMAAKVTDNLPVDVLSHEVSVNNAPWKVIRPNLPSEEASQETESSKTSAISIRNQPSVSATAEWTWDLFDLEAESGDTISTRIASLDRKGNVSYSPVLQFSLASMGFERDRHKQLYRRAELVAPLLAFAKTVTDGRDQLRQSMDRFKDRNLPVGERTRLILAIRNMADQAIQQSQQTQRLAQQIIRDTTRCVDQQEVELVVRNLSRIERHWLEYIRYVADEKLWESTSQGDANTQQWTRQNLDQKINQMISSYDAACDHAQRLPDIYRQFVGLEVLAALTMDLTSLRDHQQNVIHRKPPADFQVLVRSQHIAHQYMDGVVQLAQDMQPHVNKNLQDAFSHLFRWIDQTRQETQTLVEQEESEETTNQLRQRIERSVQELRHHRWAFHLHGGLPWETIENRRELLNRANNLSQNMDAILDKHHRRQEVLKDASLATDQSLIRQQAILSEVTGPLTDALRQWLDRRDIHSHRSIHDSNFAGDMGMAYRAWLAVLDAWKSEPSNAQKHFEDLQSITKATRILEAAHEMVEARLAVQSLRPLEQYEWRSFEGTIMHPKQWESVNHRIDVAQTWMREVSFPNGLADRYNALRWSEPTSKINDKLRPRQNAENTNWVSAASELQALLQLWMDLDREAQPTIDEARAVLARFAPTISELAQQAAAEAEKLKQQTEQLQPDHQEEPDKASETSKTVATPEQIEAQRDRLQARTDQLQDALLEHANRQNLLQPEELTTARDSDRALKLLDAVLPVMDQALAEALETAQEAATNPTPQLQKELPMKLDNAVAREEKTQKALHAIAEHFANLQKEENKDSTLAQRDPKETRAELEKLTEEALRELAQLPDASMPHEDDKDYQRAEELSELAHSDPESLLKKLEAELKKNPDMQAELSDISKANASSAAAELKNAAREEDQSARNLELQDEKLKGDKQLTRERLRDAAEQAERYGVRLLNQAAQAAHRGREGEQAQAIQQALQKLQQATHEAQYMNGEATAEEIAKATKKLQEEVDSAQKSVESFSKAMEASLERQVENNEGVLNHVRSEAQNAQNQNRSDVLDQMQNSIQQKQQRAQQANDQAQRERENLERAKENRERARKSFDENQDKNNKWPQEHLRQTTLENEKALIRKNNQEAYAQAMEAQLNQARSQREAFENAQRAQLNKPNPMSALAAEKAQQAKSQLEQVQKEIESIAKSASELPTPHGDSQSLTNAVNAQEKLGTRVENVAKQLERSARHEARLGNESGSESLSQIANRVEQTAKDPVASAESHLKSIAETTKKSEADNALQNKDKSVDAPIERPSAQPAQEALQKANRELTARANELDQQASNSSPESNASEQPKSNSESADARSHNRSNQPEAQEMARMLDELDRMVHDTASNPKPTSEDASQKPESASAKQPNPSDFQRSLQSEADKLSAKMNQARLDDRNAKASQKPANSEHSSKQARGHRPARDVPSPQKGGAYVVPERTREANQDWGKLRQQRAEDVIEGSRENYDPEFDQAIQAYYKALGKQN